ncbi:hypothetical protein IV203_004167 [Nitzschia inconspicua]|uniref:Uncharacterized protein n=1 Tax=Nitzschia inconspicua TaxID=303405 RepID=A0A9K3L4W4_9STRA|nr:hypothetical protein IV203_004167 [Nitzschia inconspicua]
MDTGAWAYPRDEDYLWIGGVFEESATDRNSPQRGFYTLCKRDHRNPDWDVRHADLLKQHPDQVKVQLPEAMVIIPRAERVIIDSVTSNNDQLTPEYYKNEGNEDYPNLTSGAGLMKRGDGFFISIQSYKMENGRDGPFPSFDQSTELKTYNDVFVSDADDFVHNVCESPDGQYYFVVGSTYGTMPDATTYGAKKTSGALSPFISKVSFESIEILWTTQLKAKTATPDASLDARAEAFGCDVIPHDHTAIFVAQMSTSDGKVQWLKQIGSSGKENMARNNGVFADMEGDCLHYGDTNCELYRTRHERQRLPISSW